MNILGSGVLLEGAGGGMLAVGAGVAITTAESGIAVKWFGGYATKAQVCRSEATVVSLSFCSLVIVTSVKSFPRILLSFLLFCVCAYVLMRQNITGCFFESTQFSCGVS